MPLVQPILTSHEPSRAAISSCTSIPHASCSVIWAEVENGQMTRYFDSGTPYDTLPTLQTTRHFVRNDNPPVVQMTRRSSLVEPLTTQFSPFLADFLSGWTDSLGFLVFWVQICGQFFGILILSTSFTKSLNFSIFLHHGFYRTCF